jgi:hypothetical protein
MAGKLEKSSGRAIYRDPNIITREIVIFSAKQTSRTGVGSGNNRIAMIATNATGIRRCMKRDGIFLGRSALI